MTKFVAVHLGTIFLIFVFGMFIPVTKGISSSSAAGTINALTGLTELMGCYEENTTHRHFTINPGLSQPGNSFFTECAQLCQKLKNLGYVAFSSNETCLCGPTPIAGKKMSTATQCPKRCSNLGVNPIFSKDCGGGDGRISVYKTQYLIEGLNITGDGRSSKVLMPLTYTGVTTDGVKTPEMSFKTSDGRYDGKAANNAVSIFFLEPGKHSIQVQASRTDVESKTVTVLVETEYAPMTASTLNLQVTCPIHVSVGERFTCNITVDNTSPDFEIKIAWGDTTQQTMYLGETQLYYVGEFRREVVSTANPITKASIDLVLLMAETPFLYEGAIVGVDIHQSSVATAGTLVLQLYRPKCVNGTKYCFSHHPYRRCQQECDQTKQAVKTKCLNGSVYDIAVRQCRQGVTIVQSGQVPNLPGGKIPTGVVYQFVEEFAVTTQTGGGVFMLKTPKVEVKPGDIPGVAMRTVSNILTWDGPVASNNSLLFNGGNIGTYTVRNSASNKFTITDVSISERRSGSPLLRFNVMRRTRTTVEHTYASPGLFPAVVRPQYRKADKTLTEVVGANKQRNIACSKFEMVGDKVYVREDVTFKLNLPNLQNLKCIFDAGDGLVGNTTLTQPQISYRYLKPGQRTAILKVQDATSNKELAHYQATINVEERASGLSVSVTGWPVLPQAVKAVIEFTVAQGSSLTLTATIDKGGSQKLDVTKDFGTIGNIKTTSASVHYKKYVISLPGRKVITDSVLTLNFVNGELCFRRCITEMKHRCTMYYFLSGKCTLILANVAILNLPFSTGIDSRPGYELNVIKDQLCGANIGSEKGTKMQAVVKRSGVDEVANISIVEGTDPSWCLPSDKTGVTADQLLISLPGAAKIYAVSITPVSTYRRDFPAFPLFTSLDGGSIGSARAFSSYYTTSSDQHVITLNATSLGRYIKINLSYISSRPCVKVKVRACHAISSSHTVKFTPSETDRKYVVEAKVENKDKTITNTVSTEFTVEKLITGFKMSVPESLVYSKPMDVTYTYDAGSPVYPLAELNGTSCTITETTGGGTITINSTVYNKGPGLYQLIFKLSNRLSDLIENSYSMFIDYGVLYSTIEPKLTYVRRLKPYIVTTTVGNGDKINMTVDFKTSTEIRYNETKGDNNDTVNILEKTFDSIGMVNVSYFIWNRVNNLSDYSIVFVQNPPEDLSISSDTPVTMIKNSPKVVNFNLTFKGLMVNLPTNVSMAIDYGDGTDEILEIAFSSRVFSFRHTYHELYATHSVKVNVSNYVGHQILEHTVECDEAIVLGAFNISTRMVNTYNNVTITAVLEKGTRADQKVTYGDGFSETRTITANRTVIIVSRVYKTPGIFKPFVEYNNTVSSQTQYLDDQPNVGRTVFVQRAVVGFSIAMPEINTIGDKKVVNVIAMLMIRRDAVRATNTRVKVDYGDGSAVKVVPFSCKKVPAASNTNGTTTSSNTTTDTNTTTSKQSATNNLTTSTAGEDKNGTTAANSTGDQNKPPTKATTPLDECFDLGGHDFPPGVFNVTAKIENLVSEQTVHTEVGAYVRVAGVAISSRFTTAKTNTSRVVREVTDNLEEGKGLNKDVFPMLQEIHFKIAVEFGNGLTYAFDFGDGSAPITTASPTVSHKYTKQGDYVLQVLVANPISNVTAKTDIKIYGPIGKISIDAEIKVVIKEDHTFTFVLDEVARHGCYRCDFNSKNGLGGHRYAVVGTEKDCKEFYPEITNRFDLPADLETTKTFSITNRFWPKFTSVCHIEGRNLVSYGRGNDFTLIVTLGPCEKPAIEIANEKGALITDEMECTIPLCKDANYREITIANSKKISLVPTCKKYECDSYDGTFGVWSVRCAVNGKELLEDCTKEYFTKAGSDGSEYLRIEGGLGQRWLKGYYEIIYTCCMSQEPALCSTNTMHLKVVNSPLQARFRAGIFRSVYFKTNVTFDCGDPTLIKDPDALEGHEQDGVTFAWQGFHSSIASKYFMGEVEGGELTEEKITKENEYAFDTRGCLELHTIFFVEGESYRIFMTVSKAGRKPVSVRQEITILIGNPPQISIEIASPSYQSNVDGVEVGLVNTRGKMKMRTLIKDRVRGLEYKFSWDLAANWVPGKTVLDFKSNMINQTDLEKKATTGVNGIDIAMVENLLEEGKTYCVRLQVKRPSSGWGKAYIIIEGNRRPDPKPFNFKCKPNKVEGEALKTAFHVKCTGKMRATGRQTFTFLTKRRLTDTSENFVQSGSEPELNTDLKLPPGDPSNGHKYIIVVKCTDSVGSDTDIFIEVKVTTPKPPPGQEDELVEVKEDEIKAMTPNNQIAFLTAIALTVFTSDDSTTDSGGSSGTDSGSGTDNGGDGGSVGGDGGSIDTGGGGKIIPIVVKKEKTEEEKKKEAKKLNKKKDLNKKLLTTLAAAADMGTKSVDMVLKVSTAAAAITEDPTTQSPESVSMCMNLLVSMADTLDNSETTEEGNSGPNIDGAMKCMHLSANLKVAAKEIKDEAKRKAMEKQINAILQRNAKKIIGTIVVNEGPKKVKCGSNMDMLFEKKDKENIAGGEFGNLRLPMKLPARKIKNENETAFSTTVEVQIIRGLIPTEEEDMQYSDSNVVTIKNDLDVLLEPDMSDEPALLGFETGKGQSLQCTNGNSTIEEDAKEIHEVEVKKGHALELTFACQGDGVHKCGLDVYLSVGPSIPKTTDLYGHLPIKDDCPCETPTNPYVLFISRDEMKEMIEKLPKKNRKGSKVSVKFFVKTWTTEDLPSVFKIKGSNKTLNATQKSTTTKTDDQPKSTNQATGQTKSTDEATNQTKSTGQATDQTKSTDEATDQTKSTDEATDQTKSADQATDQTKSADQATDQTKSTDQATDQTKSADQATDQTKSADQATDRTKSTDQATDQTKSADQATDQTKSTDKATDQTKSTDQATDQTRSTDKGNNQTNSTASQSNSTKLCDVEKYESYKDIEKTMIETNYQVCTRTVKIMYKDPKSEQYLDDGVTPSRCSNSTVIMGYTKHLSAFISAITTPPNKITPGLGFASLNENPVCMAVSVAVFGLYLAVLIWARKADKRDKQKVGVTPLTDNHQRDRYLYTITVYTGFRNNAGTTARVAFVLVGDEDETKPRSFKDDKRITLKKGSVDSFLMAVPRGLGKLSHLRLWHDNSGKSPSWYFSRMLIEDVQTQEKFYFICDRWLAVEEDDGMISRMIPVAGLAELTSFQHLFWAKTSRKLTDDHIWFSILHRPARSPFTRVQRLTCCLSLLFCTMMANIMWFGTEKDVEQPGVLRIGPIAVSVRTVWVTFITALTVFPVNLLIVSLFRYRKPRQTRKIQPPLQEQAYISEHELSDISKLEDSMNSTKSSSSLNSSGGAFIISNMDQPIIPVVKEKKPKKKTTPKKGCKVLPFPWWTIFPAYGLAFGSVGASFFVIIETGGTLGYYGAGQWLSAMLFGIAESIFLSQPIKIVLMALVYALIIRKPDQEDENERPDAEALAADEEWVYPTSKPGEYTAECQAAYPPPDTHELSEAREERLKEMEMKKVIKDLMYYLIFVVMLFLVTGTNKDYNLHLQNEAMKKQFFEGSYTHDNGYKHQVYTVTDSSKLWNYINFTLLPTVYGEFTVQGKIVKSGKGFIADGVGYLVGQPRLRLLRLKNDTCDVPTAVNKFIPNCHGTYSLFDEDETKFKVGWTYPNYSDPTDLPDPAWSFQSALGLYGYPYMGKVGLYGGGGYVADLGTTLQDARKLIKVLFDNKWIDRLTRALFVEFVIYNGNVDAYTTSQLLFEYYEGGGIVRYPRLHTMHLDQHSGNMVGLLVAAEIIIVICMFYFMAHEIKLIWKQRRAYFKGFWNWWEVCLIQLGFTTIILFFMRFAMSQYLESYIIKNKGKFINFQYLILLDEVYSYIIGLLTFTSTMKLLKLLKFNRKMSMLGDVLRYASWYLLHFGLVFFIMFFAYVQMAYLFFGRDVFDFKTVFNVMETLFVMLLNKFDFRAMVEAQPVLGPLFFFLYSLFVSMILINFFLSIICEAFTAVKLDKMTQSNDYEVVDYMVSRFRRFMNISSPTDRRPNPTMTTYVRAPGESEDPLEECEQGLDKFMLLLDRYLKDDPLTHKMQLKAEKDAKQALVSDDGPSKRKRAIKIA